MPYPPPSLTRRAVLRLAALGTLAAGLVPGVAPGAERRALGLRRISIRSTRPFAGDRTLLATVSPGSPTRDRVAVRFGLDRPARVTVEAVRMHTRRVRPVWRATAQLPAGRHRFLWKPDGDTPPGTYVMRLTVRAGRDRVVYGKRRPRSVDLVRAPVVRVLGIEAAFGARSYAPGQLARMRVSADADVLSIQVFRAGGEDANTDRPDEMKGVAVAPPKRHDWTRWRDKPVRIGIRVGDWPSGLYFARLIASDGRRGYAPFVVRPGVFGASRIAVVLPTYTWQAYNYRDADGDGWGDTWYAGGSPPVRLDRPFLNRGVPPYYRRYDLPFLRWLHRTGREDVDYLSEEDLGRFDGDALRRAYDLIVFPGHTEYVTEHEYVVVERFRDLGGNLMFLSANNFFWKIRRRGDAIRRVALWRDLGRPEIKLLGTQYRANDDGTRQAPFVVTGADVAPWAFAGTGLENGSTIGHEVGGYGIEIDSSSFDAPAATHVLAAIPDLFGAGVSAHMTYYEHASGAKVFSAGALDFGGSIAFSPTARRLLENVWRHLAP